jgi:hypothetical protein
MAIVYLKLDNDSDVVADVSETIGDPRKVTLTNAIRMVPTQQGWGMMPLCPFSKDKSFDIRKEYIVTTGEVEDELLNAYNAKFGGVIIANAPIIVNPND